MMDIETDSSNCPFCTEPGSGPRCVSESLSVDRDDSARNHWVCTREEGHDGPCVACKIGLRSIHLLSYSFNGEEFNAWKSGADEPRYIETEIREGEITPVSIEDGLGDWWPEASVET